MLARTKSALSMLSPIPYCVYKIESSSLFSCIDSYRSIDAIELVGMYHMHAQN